MLSLVFRDVGETLADSRGVGTYVRGVVRSCKLAIESFDACLLDRSEPFLGLTLDSGAFSFLIANLVGRCSHLGG